MVIFNKIGTSENGGYSIFENPDKELVEKIKQVTLDEDVDLKYDGSNGIFRGKKRRFKVTSKLSDTQLMCQYIEEDDNSCFIIDIDKFEELKVNLLKEKINTLYPISKYAFFNNLVYKKSDSNEYFDANKITLITDGIFKGDSQSQTIWITEYSGTDYTNSSWNRSIRYKRDNGGHIFFSYFDFDGNYNVRDYNMNFNNIIQENILTEEEIITKCLDALYNVEKPSELEYYGGKWYSENFMYILYDEEEREGIQIIIADKTSTDSKSNVFYKNTHYSGRSLKKPSKKNLVIVDFNHMAEAFRNRIHKTYEKTE